MSTVECPHCHLWEEVCFVINPDLESPGPIIYKCPSCSRLFHVYTECYPIHFGRIIE